MRIKLKIQGSLLFFTIVLVYAFLFWLLQTSKAVAETDSLSGSIELESMYRAPGNLRMDCRTYIKNHKPSYTRRARQVTVKCVDLADNTHRTYRSKSGKLSLEFRLDTRYLVYVSKEGYETKMLAFSTKGVEPTAVYEFDFDLILEKSGKATYSEYTPSIYVVYNPMHRLFLYRRFLYRSASNR